MEALNNSPTGFSPPPRGPSRKPATMTSSASSRIFPFPPQSHQHSSSRGNETHAGFPSDGASRRLLRSFPDAIKRAIGTDQQPVGHDGRARVETAPVVFQRVIRKPLKLWRGRDNHGLTAAACKIDPL